MADLINAVDRQRARRYLGWSGRYVQIYTDLEHAFQQVNAQQTPEQQQLALDVIDVLNRLDVLRNKIDGTPTTATTDGRATQDGNGFVQLTNDGLTSKQKYAQVEDVKYAGRDGLQALYERGNQMVQELAALMGVRARRRYFSTTEADLPHVASPLSSGLGQTLGNQIRLG